MGGINQDLPVWVAVPLFLLAAGGAVFVWRKELGRWLGL